MPSPSHPVLYLAVIPNCSPNLTSGLSSPLCLLQLWLPDAIWQRPEPHPHQQLRLQLGDHRGLRGQRRPGAAAVLLSLVPTAETPPSLSTSNVKQTLLPHPRASSSSSSWLRTRDMRTYVDTAPVFRTQATVRKFVRETPQLSFLLLLPLFINSLFPNIHIFFHRGDKKEQRIAVLWVFIQQS